MKSVLDPLALSELEALALEVLLRGSWTFRFSSSDSFFAITLLFLGFAALFGSDFLLIAGFLTLVDFLIDCVDTKLCSQRKDSPLVRGFAYFRRLGIVGFCERSRYQLFIVFPFQDSGYEPTLNLYVRKNLFK